MSEQVPRDTRQVGRYQEDTDTMKELESMLVDIVNTPIEEIGISGDTWINHIDGRNWRYK